MSAGVIGYLGVAIDPPPVGMTTPIGARDVAQYAVGAVVAVMLVAALMHWRRAGRPTGVLLLVGGFFCSLNEALVDQLGHCFFPPDDAIAYSAFGYAVPWWVVTAYAAFFGGLTWINSELLPAGWSRGRMWTAIAAVWVLNLILEMPILAAGVYVYYGEQPFEVGGFPLNWLVINALGSLFASVVVARGATWLSGRRQLALIVVPWSTYFLSWVCHLPLFVTMNADVPLAARWAAALVSAVLGLIAMDTLLRIGTTKRGLATSARSGELTGV